jgi:hypothetical protein
MWLPNRIVEQVSEVARIYYFSVVDTKRWNENRKAGELRMLTGWCWTEKGGTRHAQGFKTMTVAYRDAWYALVDRSEPPVAQRPTKLRVVARKEEAA